MTARKAKQILTNIKKHKMIARNATDSCQHKDIGKNRTLLKKKMYN